MTVPHSGQFRILLSPTGEATAPDLTPALWPILAKLAGREIVRPLDEPCDVETPQLASLRTDGRDRRGFLDEKIAQGRRNMRSCTLCEHRCGVDREAAALGVCQLDSRLSVSGYSMLYNEGPLVGQPTFGVYLRGCSLRCRYCYRPEELRAKGKPAMSPAALAKILDDAAKAGARSWHFLGGNPDESLVGILEALRLTQKDLPIVWNSALFMTPAAIELLRGVVDIWLPDFKFGNDECAQRVGRVRGYSEVIRRNLLMLRSERRVVVRCLAVPGHEECCAKPIKQWITLNLPRATVHDLRYFPPPALDRP
jgi:putative pyruvate formate lyase activating enzyme